MPGWGYGPPFSSLHNKKKKDIGPGVMQRKIYLWLGTVFEDIEKEVNIYIWFYNC